ncbi:MAG TPA: response regulator [Gemmataceae bacterium]|nr:response regulator [Gemmataceae bacterium]
MSVAVEDFAGFRPCLILAHADSVYAARVLRAFRRQGWDVYAAHSGPEARRLARMLQPQVVVLQADLPEESGWLTCDKLTRENPSVRVVLVGDDPTPHLADFAAFVGAAALIGRADGAGGLLDYGQEPALPLPAVG